MEEDGAAATRILMGVNESSLKGYPHPSISSRNAFEWTLRKIVRSNTRGFTFLFLHVQVPDENAFDDMDSVYASPDDFKRMKNRDRLRGLHLLEYFVARCHQIGLDCEAWIKKGDPTEVICSEVKRVRPDLLVVGKRGLGPFQSGHGFPLGATADLCRLLFCFDLSISAYPHWMGDVHLKAILNATSKVWRTFPPPRWLEVATGKNSPHEAGDGCKDRDHRKHDEDRAKGSSR